jgi:hypothetical protein
MLIDGRREGAMFTFMEDDSLPGSLISPDELLETL